MSDDKVVVSINLQESDFQRANFGFFYSKWSNKLMIALPVPGLIYGFLVLPSISYSNPGGFLK
jgi:hypothetical protein